MDTLRVRVKGVRPLLFHSGQLADPLNTFAKRIKEITGKRSKTEADLEAIANLEWTGSLYVNEEERVVIPSYVIEATVKSGAKKFKRGKDCDQAVYVERDAVLQFPDKDKTIEELREMTNYRLSNQVRIQGRGKVTRTRPMFKIWEAEFGVTYDSSVFNKEDLVQCIEAAGMQVGFCDWRPKYGRFSVEVI